MLLLLSENNYLTEGCYKLFVQSQDDYSSFHQFQHLTLSAIPQIPCLDYRTLIADFSELSVDDFMRLIQMKLIKPQINFIIIIPDMVLCSPGVLALLYILQPNLWSRHNCLASLHHYLTVRDILSLPPTPARPITEILAPGRLNSHQQLVFRYMLSGLQDKQISDILQVNEKTVSSQRRTIYRRLGVQNRLQFIHHFFSKDKTTFRVADYFSLY